MLLVKVGAAVLNQTPLDWDGNAANIRLAIRKAREAQVSLLCLPELCITGYGCEDMFHSAGVLERAWRQLEALVPDTQGLVVSFGLPVLHQNGVFNCACLVADGRILGLVAKQFLAGDGIHYEPRWFKPWQAGVVSPYRPVFEGKVISGADSSTHNILIGDQRFNVGGVRIGFEICEDAWVATRPGARHSLAGVDLILNPSASHFAFGKIDIRTHFVMEGSRAFGVTYLYANLLGNESGRAIFDGGALIASGGELLATGPRFSFDRAHLTTAVVDVDRTRMSQARTVSFRPDLELQTQRYVACDFAYARVSYEETDLESSTRETRVSRKEEEFTRAQTLALFDYMRKSRSRGFVVSLSGGADSAAVCSLVYLMVQRVLNDIGLEGLRERLSYIPELKSAGTIAEIMPILLATAYQASENSGHITRDAAQAVASALHSAHTELQIGALVKGYIGMIEASIGRPLTWATDDITLQNIQARVRAPSIWMIANIRNALLLATSNRSEAAVGYATMDGDTAGGLSPIAGIDKAWLRSWLRWLETTGPQDLGPIPALHAINVQQPTAELRPQEQAQTDEADLMPYPLLDVVERAAIRDKRTPLECYQQCRYEFPQYAPRQLLVWIERFFRLWCRNQWKRERYAPSFHLDDENLDPRSWCRFPILSGGFELELREMRAWVERHEQG